jgi:hypothetical protein
VIASGEEERLTEFNNLSLGKTIKKHEEDGENHVFFLEEGDE